MKYKHHVSGVLNNVSVHRTLFSNNEKPDNEEIVEKFPEFKEATTVGIVLTISKIDGSDMTP